MSEMRETLLDTARTVFAGAAASAHFEGAWAMVAEAGFPSLLLQEASGGFGGDWGDFFAVARQAGNHALALPIGETILATSLLEAAGETIPAGPLSIAPRVEGEIADDGRFRGRFNAVPWGASASAVVGAFEGRLILARRWEVERQGVTPADEPRADLRADDAVVLPLIGDPFIYGAFLRVAQSAGALSAALAIAIDHANSRVQFGKPLGKFQAVQQALATFAEEAAAVDTAGQAAALALDHGNAAFEVAAAKLRTNIAISSSTAIAHQVLGAIGFTREHPLHHSTRRLMAWASEFGNENYWSGRLGEMVLAAEEGLWTHLTARSDALITQG